MNFLILAAGKSSRIFNKINKNKCLIKIKNKSLLQIAIEKILKLSRVKEENISIVTGFRHNAIKKHLSNKKKIKLIYNKDYFKREMLHSMIYGIKKLKYNDDLILLYSDILFSNKLLKLLIDKKTKHLTLPILKDWKKIWKIKNKNIFEDAEDLIVNDKKKLLIKIGHKIKKNNIPKYQYMGIIYIPKKNQKQIVDLHKSKKNIAKMHITEFLNYLIKEDINIKILPTTYPWYEIDDYDDYNNLIKNKKFLDNV